jgi:hypothetical protein
MNGLDPAAPLLAGTSLTLPAGVGTASQPTAGPTGVRHAAPQPTMDDVMALRSQFGGP